MDRTRPFCEGQLVDDTQETIDARLKETSYKLKRGIVGTAVGELQSNRMPDLVVMTGDTLRRLLRIENIPMTEEQVVERLKPGCCGPFWGTLLAVSATEVGVQFVAAMQVQFGKRVLVVADDGSAEVWSEMP